MSPHNAPAVDSETGGGVADAAALRAAEVRKHYGDVVALDGVSVEVADGETVALIGESGSGKTTLLRCFNRMVAPDTGRVYVGGAAADQVDAVELRRRIGYVQQDGGLLPHWRVLRNAALVPWLQGAEDAGDAAAAALRLVGLPPESFAQRWPSELSGGQRQRVAIARAIASRPRVLLLDEPFGALDAITRSELHEMFAELRCELKITTLLVTHDLHEATRLCERIAVLRGGQIEQVAPAEELLAAPATPYVAELLRRAHLQR
jgi:osmoprotectant transport system ATP-binding protein